MYLEAVEVVSRRGVADGWCGSGTPPVIESEGGVIIPDECRVLKWDCKELESETEEDEKKARGGCGVVRRSLNRCGHDAVNGWSTSSEGRVSDMATVIAEARTTHDGRTSSGVGS